MHTDKVYIYANKQITGSIKAHHKDKKKQVTFEALLRQLDTAIENPVNNSVKDNPTKIDTSEILSLFNQEYDNSPPRIDKQSSGLTNGICEMIHTLGKVFSSALNPVGFQDNGYIPLTTAKPAPTIDSIRHNQVRRGVIRQVMEDLRKGHPTLNPKLIEFIKKSPEIKEIIINTEKLTNPKDHEDYRQRKLEKYENDYIKLTEQCENQTLRKSLDIENILPQTPPPSYEELFPPVNGN